MRSVLIITFFFPPIGGGASIRTTKFVKYLPQLGWRPIVLTVNQDLSIQDDKVLKDIPPEATIIRTPPPFFNRLRTFFVKRLIKNKTPQTSKKVNNTKQKNSTSPNILLRMGNAFEIFLSQLLFIPDQNLFWRRYAIKYAKKILKKQKIDLIYTTCPPHSLHKIGYKLSKKFKIPWITDFRDVWTFTPLKKWGPWEYYLERKMEKNVINNAHGVIATTQPSLEYLQKRYSGPKPNKFSIITNGFDPDDFLKKSEYQKSDILKISFFGGIAKPHVESFQLLLKIIYELVRKNKIAKNSIQLKVYSSINPNIFKTPGQKYDIPYSGFISHDQALLEYQKSDILLLILDDRFATNSYPGKMFEYLAAQRPILALVNPGIVQDFIKTNNLGWAVGRNNSEKINTALEDIISKWKNNELFVDTPNKLLNEFSRKKLTKKLSDKFESAL